MKFFDEQVDENSNLLLLCVHTYIRNDWVRTCSEIYKSVYEDLIHPYMRLLGIDDAKNVEEPNRNWNGVRAFWNGKITEMRKKAKELDSGNGAGTGIGGLHSAVLRNIIVAAERQLAYMNFFSETEGEQEDGSMGQDLTFAPLTNLTAESAFASFDRDVKMSGGTTSVVTLSNKRTIKINKYLKLEEFLILPADQKRERWQWAFNSEAAKDVAEMLEEHMDFVEEVQALAVDNKRKRKEKKATRHANLLVKIAGHGGPVNEKNIRMLPGLNIDQVLLEVSYLRNTSTPGIKSKRLVKSDSGNRFEILPIEVLKDSIRSVICPSSNVTKSVEELLRALLEEPDSYEYEGRKVIKMFNDGKEYEGTVKESFGPGQKRMHHVEVFPHLLSRAHSFVNVTSLLSCPLHCLFSTTTGKWKIIMMMNSHLSLSK